MPKYQNLSLKNLQKLGGRLARQTSKKPVTIGLIGNLGSGKTTFAKAFAKKLGIKSLKSPTFIISERYPLGKHYLYHLDFYRLKSLHELRNIGLTEILSNTNVVLIEWVDKFSKIMRQCNIIIKFQTKNSTHRDVQIKYN